MLYFIGSHPCKLDDKNRLQFPVALKKQLEGVLHEGFVIRRGTHSRCLELYPLSEWKKEMDNISRINQFIPENQAFIRMFLAGANLLELDASHRLLISKDLAEYAGLKKEVRVTSAINKFEIWDLNAYEQTVNNPDTDMATLSVKVMGNMPPLNNQ